jgi:hypothetical protein
MSIIVRFSPEGLTTDQYDAVRARLTEAGQWPADGLEHHVCFGADGHLKIVEIWRSTEQFEAFGQHLMPILTDERISLAGPPESLEIYKQERF